MSGISEKLQSLHLSVDPFADTTPLANLFPGGKRRHILEQMVALTTESSQIIAIVGASGSGKSTLADFATRQASQHHAVARIRASLLTSPLQLLQEMFKAFVLDFSPHSSLVDLQDDLGDYLDRLADQGRKAILIVDDAHELGDEAFSLLVHISLDDNPANTFRLILLGERALADMLDYTCPLRGGQPSFQLLQLPAFSTEESSHYLRFRLNNAGFRQRNGVPALPFERRQIHRIHKRGGGQPGPINAAASELLRSAPSGLPASLQKVLPGNLLSKLPRSLPFKLPSNLLGSLQAKMPDNLSGKYVAAGGVLVVVLLLAFMLGSGESDVETVPRTVSLPVPLNAAAPDSANEDEDETVPQRSIASAAAPEPTASGSSVSSAPSAEPAPAPGAPASQSPASASVAVVASEPESESEPEPEPEPVQEPAPVAPAPTPAVASTASSAPATAPAAAPTDSSTPAPNSVAAPASAAATDGLIAQEALIQALPADNFTLQLLGASSRSNVEAFVDRHASDELYWYETIRQQRPWYVVIHGAYSSPNVANAAVADLPETLREQQPWVRNIGDVQRESEAGN